MSDQPAAQITMPQAMPVRELIKQHLSILVNNSSNVESIGFTLDSETGMVGFQPIYKPAPAAPALDGDTDTEEEQAPGAED